MKLYIIPGYKETIKQYNWLIRAAQIKYEVVFLNLQLTDKPLSELIKTKIDSNAVVFGFSTGALIAYKLETVVKKGIYCSLSEILGSDAKDLNVSNEMNEIFGKETAETLKKMRYGKSRAKEIVLFCGDKELTPRIFKLGEVKVIKNTGHKLTQAYRRAILNELGIKSEN